MDLKIVGKLKGLIKSKQYSSYVMNTEKLKTDNKKNNRLIISMLMDIVM